MGDLIGRLCCWGIVGMMWAVWLVIFARLALLYLAGERNRDE